jgi:perosamine synthetase
VQAALGRSQLRRYRGFLDRRRAIANRYFTGLAGLDVRLPLSVRDRTIFFRFPLRTPRDFDEIRSRFARAGVHVRRGVDALLHRTFGPSPADFEGAERCFAETVSLPLYPALTDADCSRVIEASQQVFPACRQHSA